MTFSHIAVEVGQQLRMLRELRGLSQARLAERTGISQQRVSNLERGVVQPRLMEWQRLFAGLGRRFRVESVPLVESAAEDPELLVKVDPPVRAE